MCIEMFSMRANVDGGVRMIGWMENIKKKKTDNSRASERKKEENKCQNRIKNWMCYALCMMPGHTIPCQCSSTYNFYCIYVRNCMYFLCPYYTILYLFFFSVFLFSWLESLARLAHTHLYSDIKWIMYKCMFVWWMWKHIFCSYLSLLLLFLYSRRWW